MPTPSHIVRFRQRRREKLSRAPGGKLGIGLGVIFSILLVLGIFTAVASYITMTADLPSLESIPTRLEPPNGSWLQPTRLYDRTGEHILLTLQYPGAAGWRYLTVATGTQDKDSFATSLVQATISASDPTFWENPGYSWRLFSQGDLRTLAEQLVSDLLLADETPSLRRTLRERILAGQLIQRFGHTKILEWYLNSRCYGPLVYGADAASLAYFEKSASELSLAEAAWLVAASSTPAINPLAAQHSVTERQRQIIYQMLQQAAITEQEASLALAQALDLRSVAEQNNPDQVFTNLVIEQLHQALPTTPIERGGLQIITSLDYDLQMQSSCALAAQVNWLRGRPAESMAVDGAACEAARLLPTLALEARDGLENIAASVVVIDPLTGQVLAMAGQAQAGLDPAHLPGQPAGTLLTPFIYLSAFVRGFSPGTLIWEVPQVDQPGGEVLASEGEEISRFLESTYHGPVRVRTALANDYLPAASQVSERVGVENAWQTAWQFGMISLGEQPLGTGTFQDFLSQEVTLLESAHAFSVFSNLGRQTGQRIPAGNLTNQEESLKPVSVIRVVDESGAILLDWSRPQEISIVIPQLAYLVTNVLSDEAARWSSLGHPNPLEIGRPAGVRLGVSLDGSQAWTIGFTPQLVVGSWLGLPDGDGQVVPKLASAALWNAVTRYASQDLAVEDWEMPAGLTRLPVCDPSGLLPTNACPTVVDEIFLAGSEPIQADNLYQLLRINHETGQLATVFTPAELVDEQVFLVVPDWAEPWAEQAGLPVPPQSFDPIYVAQQSSADLRMTEPVMFAHVHGIVELWGSAAGSYFAYYRIQAGQGLNPKQWLLVGEDGQQPVSDGKLGEWNTQGLQGLYVVQLSVVRANQRVDSVFIQVTVDNNPPELSIMDPGDGELFLGDAGENILFQVSASDDLVLERLEFYVDDELYRTIWQPPFACMWPASLGEHTLQVRAFDRAGNMAEQTIQFEYPR